jgi:hypothetical protein
MSNRSAIEGYKSKKLRIKANGHSADRSRIRTALIMLQAVYGRLIRRGTIARYSSLSLSSAAHASVRTPLLVRLIRIFY